jgi:N-acetylmuramoyl-L-alanine amidase
MRWTNLTRAERKPMRGLLILLCCAWLTGSATPVYQQPSSTPPQTTPQQQEPPAQNSETPKPAAPEFVVMIDAGHGGDDRGAIFGGKLQEKDVTLSLARQLRWELESRGIAARLVRESDTNISLEHRAEATNAQHTSVYIALHAGEPGSGVRVYASLLPSAQMAGRFVPWEAAQSNSLERSKAIADAVARELQKTNLPVARLNSPLRPLNNIVAPAIAVELAADSNAVRGLFSAKLQNSVAVAVASGIARSRGQTGGQP